MRFPSKPYLPIMTHLARFGGFALMPSIATTREATPGLRYRRRFRSLTYDPGLRQRRTAPVRYGWLQKEKVCSIGKREYGIDSKPRQNSQILSPGQPLRIGWAAYGSDTRGAQSSC